MSEDVSQEVEALFQQMFAAGELEREDWYDFGGKLHQIGRPALSRALELAHDPNPEVRERSAFVLGQLTDHEVSRQSKVQDGIPTLLSLLEHDPELEVRLMAANALSHLSSHEAIPLVIPLIDSPDSDARYAAAFALFCFGDESQWKLYPHLKPMVQEGLLRLTHDSDDKTRDYATCALHSSGHDTPEVHARFWELLDDPDGNVCGEAARGLAKAGDKLLAPRLAQLLEENYDLHYLYDAAEILGDPALLPAIKEAAEKWKADCPDRYQISTVESAIEVLEKSERLKLH